MKNLKAKILAGVLSTAMVIGTLAGAGPLVAKAAASYETELTVRAVDESGKALSGVELIFEKDGETYDFDTTDKDGEATLDENGLQEMFFADQDAGGEGTGTYEVKPSSDSAYALAGESMKVDVEMATAGYGFPYIAKVNGEAFTGATMDLALKTGGSETPDQPSADLKTLNVKVVDQKGNPISGMQLHISSPYCCDNQFKNVTDANGKASYTLTQHEGINLPFTVAPTDDSDYEIVTALKDIYFARDTEKNENYIAKVNGKEFTGEEVTLVVKKMELNVSEVTASKTEISRAGEKVTITVKGSKLPSTLYYYATYKKQGQYAIEEWPAMKKGVAVETSGTARERSFELDLPEAEKYPGIVAWRIGIGFNDDDYWTFIKEDIAVAKDTVTEESKTTMSDALAEAEKKVASDYTEESWKTYQEAVKAAKAVAAKEDATNTEYQKAIQAVKDAEAALVKAETPEPTPSPEPTIEKKVGSVALTKTSYTYNGKTQKPEVIAKDSNGKKIAKTSYTVKYASDCKKVGKYTVKIAFKGDYKGTYTKTFKILPKGTSLKSVKAGKKSFTATWKKQTEETSGYQVQYAKDKKFTKSVKTTTVSKSTTVKKVVKKLSAKKTYYVRVRTYKKVKIGKNVEKIYSGWSVMKKVKVK